MSSYVVSSRLLTLQIKNQIKKRGYKIGPSCVKLNKEVKTHGVYKLGPKKFTLSLEQLFLEREFRKIYIFLTLKCLFGRLRTERTLTKMRCYY